VEAPGVVDRATAERVLRRAIELASAETDAVDGAYSAERLVAIGRELGMSERHVLAALHEALAGAPYSPGLLGTRSPVASRVVAGQPAAAAARLGVWLERGDGMRLLRQPAPQLSVYEPRRGFVAAARARIGADADLRECRTLTVMIDGAGQQQSLVRLEARLPRDQLVVAAAASIGGGAGSALAALTWSWPLIGFLPVAVAIGGAGVVAQRRDARRVATALERRLDLLARGDEPPDPVAVVSGALGRLRGFAGRPRKR
jgi:hypothetical protein